MIIRFGRTINKDNPKGKVNRLINLLFNVQEMLNNDDTTLVNSETLENIIEKSFGYKSAYTIEYADNFNDGQFIEVETDKEVKYINFSYEAAYSTRNGYFLSKIVIGLRKFVDDITTEKKVGTLPKERKFELFLLDVSKEVYEKHKGTNNSYDYDDLRIEDLETSTIVTPYSTFGYRLFKTCDFRVVNEDKIPFDLYIKNTKTGSKTYKEYVDNKNLHKKAFKTIDEVAKTRNSMSKNNNASSYFLVGDKLVTIYGKTFGNNGFEMIPIAYCIYVLAQKEGKEVIFYQVKDGDDPKPISKENIRFMESLGIKVYDELQDYEENPDAIIDESQDSRCQTEFKKNLLMKYGTERKCYLCNCTIPENLIASHIQRVADINKLPIPFNERRKKAVDSENGFWLCANHDKMFEFGIITFNEITGEFVLGQDYLESKELTPEQVDFIKEITKEKEIDKEHFTEELSNYLKIHNDRIKSENLKKKK